MRHLLLCLSLWLPATAFADAPADPDSFSITADQWALPRSGSALIRLQPVQAAMADWVTDPAARILIQHAGSDVGNLWADELGDWLVALGIPSDHIDKQASADQPEDAIALKVVH